MDAHELMSDRLAYLRDNLSLKRIYFGHIGASAPQGATCISVLRVNTLLSGSKLITLPLKSGVTPIDFRAGDVQFSIPDSWELQTWNTDHELLCIVARTDYLRISYYVVKDGIMTNSFFHTDRPPSEALRSTLQSMTALSREEDYDSALRLVNPLAAMAHKELQVVTVSGQGRMDYTFRQIVRYLENALDEDIDRDSVAARFELNPSYLSQLFTRMSGRSFHAYLTERRMELARHLLESSSLSVKQISEQCGFRNYVHFVRRFRELVNLSPGKYRENQMSLRSVSPESES